VLEFVEQAADSILAAVFAMGKPVALDASTEVRLTRGFISMMPELNQVKPNSGGL
jgi:hypothetical protein